METEMISSTDDPNDEVAVLVHRLYETQRRLQEIAGGQVDALVHAEGDSFLLRGTGEKLCRSEVAQRALASAQSSILNTLPAHIALLDRDGLIISVNESWRNFGELDEAENSSTSLGQNYLEVFDRAQGSSAAEAHQAAAGIRRVLSGAQRQFVMEYPSPSPTGQTHWFRLIASPLEVSGARGAVVMHVDVTAQKMADEALRESEDRFRATFEQAAVGMAHVSTEGRFLRVNDKLCAITGYPRDQLLGMTFIDITAPEDRLAGQQARADMLAGRMASYAAEKRYRHLDGSIVWIQLVTVLHRSTAGEPKYFISVFEEVTGRKFAESALRDSEQRFRGVFSAAATGIVIATPAGRFLEANAAYLQMLGYSEDELKSMSFMDVTHPDDLAAGYQLREEFVAGRRDNATFEKRYVTKSGSIRWVLASISAVRTDAGEATAVILVAEDITERRLATEKLQRSASLLSIASRLGQLGAWVLELPSRELTLSDEVRAIHELSSDSVLSVESALDFYLPEFRSAVAQAGENCVQEGTPFDLEARIITAKGRHVWVRNIGEAERDAHGTIRRVHGAFQDISARKQAEEETRLLAERLTTTIESLTDPFFTVDREWRVTYVNHATEKATRRSRTELLGKILWDEFPEMVGTEFQRQYQRAVETGVAVNFEALYPSKRWYEARAYPSSQGLAISYRNITEMRQAREAIRVSEERFRLLARATNDAIWDWDILADSVWWNDGLEILFGYRRDEIEPTNEGWLRLIHPDDAADIAVSFHRAIETGEETWSGEYRFRRKGGLYAYVLDRGYIIRDAEGRAVRMIGGMTDVTQRKSSEARIAEQAALIDQARDAILVRDLEHRILFWSKGAERLYGWTAEEATGRLIGELTRPDPDTFAEAHAIVLREDAWSGEIEIVSKTGQQLTLDNRWTLLRDSRNEPKSILSIGTDITERKKIEQQFLRAQRMESVGTLAGGIAHDLNNVLGPILLSIDLLKMKVTDPDSEELLTIIASSAKRGADMVRQVLSYARGVEGRRTPLKIEHSIREIEKFANETFLKHILVRSIIPRDLWTISADPTQIHQVLLNLCVNARDAMPNGGTLTLSAENVEVDAHYAGLNIEAKPGRYVAVQVEDTGECLRASSIESSILSLPPKMWARAPDLALAPHKALWRAMAASFVSTANPIRALNSASISRRNRIRVPSQQSSHRQKCRAGTENRFS